MLLIASESVRGSQALNEVAREMSLSPRYFANKSKLAGLLEGPWRRMALLTDADLCADTVDLLCSAGADAPLAVLIAADKPKLRSSDKAELVDRLGDVEWIGAAFDFERLAASARHCRRQMLTLAEEELEHAFENDEFIIRYQPKVERNAGAEWETREAEALVRWQHPEHGLLGPLEFLPEIEEYGMMPALTEYVLERTARQLAEWREQGLMLNGCINLASSLLTDSLLGARYAAIVEAAGIDCEDFTFELVEQDLENPGAPHFRALMSLREYGFRLSLDDFRIAAASLATFDKLPFDEIKIHASAIRDARQSPVALHVLAAVAGLAHNLGMSVCAEGVEDQATFDFLQMIECDKMQGFLISEAVLPDLIRRAYSARGASIEVA